VCGVKICMLEMMYSIVKTLANFIQFAKVFISDGHMSTLTDLTSSMILS